MKRTISTITGLLLLAGLIALSVYLFQAVGSQPASVIVEVTQAPNYPPPYTELPPTGYPPPPVVPTISETELAELSATNLAEVTAIVAKTQTARPTVEEMPIEGDKIIYDPARNFSLRLNSGWRAWPDTTTIIVNYDTGVVGEHEFPVGGVKIQIGVGELPANTAFEEWQSEWIALQTSPEFAGSGVTASTPQPITLGKYQGTTFTIKASSLHTMEIDILNKNRIFIIGIAPADSVALNDALAILSTLEILR